MCKLGICLGSLHMKETQKYFIVLKDVLPLYTEKDLSVVQMISVTLSKEVIVVLRENDKSE